MVKCSDCGFLALKCYGTNVYDEMPLHHRLSGNPPESDDVHKADPCCFIREFNLHQEIVDIQSVQKIIDKGRICNGFMKWQLGYTPKEHREMIDKEKERKWHLKELAIIVGGNILAGCLGWLLSKL